MVLLVQGQSQQSPGVADNSALPAQAPRGPLPAHTPCAVGLVGQLVPVCEGPECHTLQEPFRKRAGGWLVWLGGDPENSEQAGSQLLLGKECTDCGPPVSVRAPGGGLPG